VSEAILERAGVGARLTNGVGVEALQHLREYSMTAMTRAHSTSELRCCGGVAANWSQCGSAVAVWSRHRCSLTEPASTTCTGARDSGADAFMLRLLCTTTGAATGATRVDAGAATTTSRANTGFSSGTDDTSEALALAPSLTWNF